MAPLVMSVQVLPLFFIYKTLCIVQIWYLNVSNIPELCHFGTFSR